MRNSSNKKKGKKAIKVHGYIESEGPMSKREDIGMFEQNKISPNRPNESPLKAVDSQLNDSEYKRSASKGSFRSQQQDDKSLYDTQS